MILKITTSFVENSEQRSSTFSNQFFETITCIKFPGKKFLEIFTFLFFKKSHLSD